MSSTLRPTTYVGFPPTALRSMSRRRAFSSVRTRSSISSGSLVSGSTLPSRSLCLPQIKPEHIGDAVHPKSDGKECVPLPRRHVISARPCSTLSECAYHYTTTFDNAHRTVLRE